MLLYKEVWAQWDNAWDLDLPKEKRLAILKDAVAPSFTYTNPDSIVKDGDLDQLVQLIDQALQQTGNNLTVKHLNWYEQHSQSALQWDMVVKDTGNVGLSGWSYGRYAEDGKLLSVSDFW